MTQMIRLYFNQYNITFLNRCYRSMSLIHVCHFSFPVLRYTVTLLVYSLFSPIYERGTDSYFCSLLFVFSVRLFSSHINYDYSFSFVRNSSIVGIHCFILIKR
jgi:hypothetical protein